MEWDGYAPITLILAFKTSCPSDLVAILENDRCLLNTLPTRKLALVLAAVASRVLSDLTRSAGPVMADSFAGVVATAKLLPTELAARRASRESRTARRKVGAPE